MRKHLCRLLLGAALLGVPATVGCDDEMPTEPDVRPREFTLPDVDGDPFTLSDTRGKVVMLSFFSPTCSACQLEAPELAALHERYSDEGLVVIGVGIRSGVEALRAFKETYDLPYRVLVDDGLVSTSAYGYPVSATPTTYVINRDAELLGPYVGAQREATWTELLQPLLAEGGR